MQNQQTLFKHLYVPGIGKKHKYSRQEGPAPYSRHVLHIYRLILMGWDNRWEGAEKKRGGEEEEMKSVLDPVVTK